MFHSPPRKRFGQHFLEDNTVISTIIESLLLKREDKVIEIGPGRGAITLPLLKALNQLIVIEIDKDLVKEWQERAYANLTVMQADALEVDFTQWGENIRLVGNLPYNISTPLLIHLLNALPSIQDMHFMLQKEVVDRLVAVPCTKAYGRLTVMVQAFCEAERLFDVPPEAFYPPPKVDSAVLRLIPLEEKTRPAVDKAVLSRLLLQAFSMRRKTLGNNLKKHIPLSYLEELGIDARLRPEEVSVKEYVELALLHKFRFS